jgi:F-type H+-transporting ATPase subunit epsilon
MSYKPFKLQIMASDHMVFDGDAQSVSLPTTEGSVGILADHSNVIMAVIPGMLEYTAEGEKHQAVVSDGLLKVENGEVMILVDAAEKPEDIDEARARRAEERARQELKRANSNRDHAMVEAELSRALSRIKASKSRHTL